VNHIAGSDTLPDWTAYTQAPAMYSAHIQRFTTKAATETKPPSYVYKIYTTAAALFLNLTAAVTFALLDRLFGRLYLKQ